MSDPFADLIPKNGKAKQDASNPFADLIPDDNRGGIGELMQNEATAFDAKRVNQGSVPYGQNVGFMPSFKAGFVDDPKRKAEIYADKLFPGDPTAVARFGQNPNTGEMVYQDPMGDYKTVNTMGLGQMASDAPIYAGEAAGGLLAGPWGAVGGAGAGSMVKNAIGDFVLDDPDKSPYHYTVEPALNAGAAAVGALPVWGTAKVYNRNVVKDIGKFNKGETLKLIDDIYKSTGIQLDIAQASQLPSLKALRKWVSKYPNEASDMMAAMGDLQNQQSDQAIGKIMNMLTRESNQTTLGERGINAAAAAIDAAKLKRKQATSDLYTQAMNAKDDYGQSVMIPVFDLKEKIGNMAEHAKGSRKAALTRVQNSFGQSSSITTNEAHNIKIMLDEMLENKPTNSIGNVTRYDLTNIKNELVGVTEDNNPAYKKAQEEFAKYSEQYVNPLENSVIGTISKIDNTRASKVAGELFSGANIDPTNMVFARRVIESQDPEAWRSLTRQWIGEQWNKAMRETQAGVANPQGKFIQSVLGTPRQRKAMEHALGSDVTNLFVDTVKAFDLMRKSPIAGSDTAFNLEIKDMMQNGSIGAYLMDKLKLAHPGKWVTGDALDELVMRSNQKYIEKHAADIAQVFTDPDSISLLKEVRQIAPARERQLATFAGLITALAIHSPQYMQDDAPATQGQ